MNNKFQPQVVSDTLDWLGSTDGTPEFQFLTRFQRRWGVTLLFTSDSGTGGHGVQVAGSFNKVYNCIYDQWSNDGMNNEWQRNLFTLMAMGDETAAIRWNAGEKYPHEVYTRDMPKQESDPDDLFWERHWADAVKRTGVTVDDDASSEVSVEWLTSVGLFPSDESLDDGYDPVITAQSYLQLAMAHAPALMDLISVVQSTTRPVESTDPSEALVLTLHITNERSNR